MGLIKIRGKRDVWLATSATTVLAMAVSMLITILALWLVGQTEQHHFRLALTISVIVPLIVAAPVAYAGFTLLLKVVESKRRIEKLSRTDELTNLYNRRYFMELARRELALGARYGTPVAMLMLDMDDFKRVNNSFGHKAGDEVLLACAHIVEGTIRLTDIIGRYGGDEFLVLAPNTDSAGAGELAERIRLAFAKTPILAAEQAVHLTVSIGAVSAEGRASSMDELLQAADHALYQAKHQGRNRIVMASAPPNQAQCRA